MPASFTACKSSSVQILGAPFYLPDWTLPICESSNKANIFKIYSVGFFLFGWLVFNKDDDDVFWLLILTGCPTLKVLQKLHLKIVGIECVNTTFKSISNVSPKNGLVCTYNGCDRWWVVRAVEARRGQEKVSDLTSLRGASTETSILRTRFKYKNEPISTKGNNKTSQWRKIN